jgi:hypothetical protein
MALIGNVIADAFAGNPSVVNYAIFVSVFCMLVVLYGFAAALVESLAIPIALGVLDILATIFTFIAGVVLAKKLDGAHSCGNEVSIGRMRLLLSTMLIVSQSYLRSNSLTNGSHSMGKRCHELQASTAFFWFMFAGFAASSFFDFAGRSTSMSSRGGMRKGGPSMSQV